MSVEFSVEGLGVFKIIKEDVYVNGVKRDDKSVPNWSAWWVSDTMFVTYQYHGGVALWTLYDFRVSGVYMATRTSHLIVGTVPTTGDIPLTGVHFNDLLVQINEGGTLPNGLNLL